jgi:CheY-like chemotaxis protein
MNLSALECGATGVVFDDRKPFRDGLANYLEHYGFSVTKVSNADKVVSAFSEKKEAGFEVAFIDVVDERRGYEVVGSDIARRLSAERPDCLVILITGHADQLEQSAHEAARVAGADLVVDKGKLDLLEHGASFAEDVWTALVRKRVTRIVRTESNLDARSVAAGMIHMLGSCSRLIKVEQLDAELGACTKEIYPAVTGGQAGHNPNAENVNAFRNDRDRLLSTYPGQFVAYHGGKLIAVGADRNSVYSAARQKIGPGLIMVQAVVPASEEPSVRWRTPPKARTARFPMTNTFVEGDSE